MALAVCVAAAAPLAVVLEVDLAAGAVAALAAGGAPVAALLELGRVGLLPRHRPADVPAAARRLLQQLRAHLQLALPPGSAVGIWERIGEGLAALGKGVDLREAALVAPVGDLHAVLEALAVIVLPHVRLPAQVVREGG